MANFNRSVFSTIHNQHSCIIRLQESINAQFQLAMDTLGKTEKPLSLSKLISAGLIIFIIPKNCTFVTDGQSIDMFQEIRKVPRKSDRVTGFIDRNCQLVGWGLKVNSDGETFEGVWDGQGHWIPDGVVRLVDSTFNRVCKFENGRDKLGRTNYKDGRIFYKVDFNLLVDIFGKSTFNQEAEDFAN